MSEMTVSVRLFAILRERAGRERIEVALPAGATVADALHALAREGALGELIERMPVALAVNRQYAHAGTPLSASDELALIPPLSGGATELRARVHVRVAEEPLSLDRLSRAVADPRAGAIVLFEGVTREIAHLDYEAYVEMARELMESIAQECARAHGLLAVAAEHRLGEVPLGEASVIVAASAPHRAAAFAGARELIDRIKAQAPIWKREDSGEWVKGTVPPGGREGR